jgi:hypothetical protein
MFQNNVSLVDIQPHRQVRHAPEMLRLKAHHEIKHSLGTSAVK